jgi:hypothetical protein
MAINILGITLGGEAARKREAANVYASKYPLTGDANALRETLAKATIELSDLKSQKPESSADKRTQQRNITALSSWTIKLQSAINDANTGVGGANNNYKFTLPTADTLLRRSPFDTAKVKIVPISKELPKKTTVLVSGLDAKPTEEDIVDNTDGGQPQITTIQSQRAVGDYPPPQGVQGPNYGKWIGLSLLAVGVVTTGYVLVKKYKK